MKFVSDLPHDYGIELLHEVPGNAMTEPIYHYPGAHTSGGKDGLLVRIEPKGKASWLGRFAFGDMEASAFDGAYSCPNPKTICIVSYGVGYMVNSEDANEWMDVHSYPVLEVQTHFERNLLLFIDFTIITAYGPSGVVWRTDRLAEDGIIISEITDDSIHGFGTCLCTEGRPRYPFVVDLQSGKHTGDSYGSSEEHS